MACDVCSLLTWPVTFSVGTPPVTRDGHVPRAKKTFAALDNRDLGTVCYRVMTWLILTETAAEYVSGVFLGKNF